jgi:hypothetical protein
MLGWSDSTSASNVVDYQQSTEVFYRVEYCDDPAPEPDDFPVAFWKLLLPGIARKRMAVRLRLDRPARLFRAVIPHRGGVIAR